MKTEREVAEKRRLGKGRNEERDEGRERGKEEMVHGISKTMNTCFLNINPVGN